MPTEHNVHSLEALETTAILDVIGPPYAGGRPCTYYSLDPEYQSRACVSVEWCGLTRAGIGRDVRLRVCAETVDVVGAYSRSFSWKMLASTLPVPSQHVDQGGERAASPLETKTTGSPEDAEAVSPATSSPASS